LLIVNLALMGVPPYFTNRLQKRNVQGGTKNSLVDRNTFFLWKQLKDSCFSVTIMTYKPKK